MPFMEEQMGFSFGSDPEFILIDEKGNLKSAINVIKRSKEKKINLNGNFYFYDNVLAECTVKPSFSKKEAIDNIRESLLGCANLVHPFKITTIASGQYNDKELDHKDSRKSGCDAEFCAYKLKKVSSKKIKKAIKKSNFRTAGGHVHLGTTLGQSHETCIMLVRMLDLFLGIASLTLDPSDDGFARRKLYGAAGRYRQPSYGVEYRTLSNFWLASPELVELVYDICSFVIDSTQEKMYEKFWKVDYETLESDSFWNNCGDPSTCHYCHGYDVSLMKSLFESEPNKINSVGYNLKKISEAFMPKYLIEKINKLKCKKFNMYEEWNLK